MEFYTLTRIERRHANKSVVIVEISIIFAMQEDFVIEMLSFDRVYASEFQKEYMSTLFSKITTMRPLLNGWGRG